MDDRELLARFAGDGSHEAFAELVRRHSPLVYGVCRRVLDDEHAAEDAAQATFMVLMRKAAALARCPADRPLVGWLHVTARQAALQLRRNTTRRIRREREAAATIAAERAADPAIGDALRRELDAALASLSNAQRSAVLLRYVQGLSQDEAGRILGCAGETVHTHVTRALTKLRALLRRQGVEVSAGVLVGGLAASPPPAGLATAIHGACFQHAASARAVELASGMAKAAATAKAMVIAALAAATLCVAGAAAAVMAIRPTAPSPISLFVGHQAGVAGIVFLPDGTAASGGWDKALRRWRVADGIELSSASAHSDGIHGFAASADGSEIVTASSDGTAVLWRGTPPAPAVTVRGHRGRILAAAVAPEGKRIATSGLDGTIRLWTPDGTPGPVLVHGKSVWGVAFSPDGRCVASAGDDYLAVLWDAASGTRLGDFRGHNDCLRCVAFSPDGTRLATGGTDHAARVWRLADRTAELVLEHRGAVWAVAFSPDGELLATAGDDGARLWDARSGADRGGPGAAAGKLATVAFSPDGRLLATGGEDGVARVWRLADITTRR